LRRTAWLDREIVRRIPRRRTNRRLLPCFARARHDAVALARARAQDPERKQLQAIGEELEYRKHHEPTTANVAVVSPSTKTQSICQEG